MSKENLEQFLEKVDQNEELHARINDQLDNDGNISVEALIALGVENGCEFTAEDLEGAARLSDQELDEVAGGSGDWKISSKKTNLSRTLRFSQIMGEKKTGEIRNA